MPNKWNLKKEFILASKSPQRLKLLMDAGFKPIECIGADINEDVLANESPIDYVARVAAEKASFTAKKHPNICILSADTIIVADEKIIRKAPNQDIARENLNLLSGKKHHVLTGFSIISPNQTQITKVVSTTVYMKKISESEKEALIQSKEWENVAAYRIEGMLSTFVKSITGSYPNIVGLPVYEVGDILKEVLK
jgi:septum formation protein